MVTAMNKPILLLKNKPTTELETQLLVWDITSLLQQTMATDQLVLIAAILRKERNIDNFLIQAQNYVEVRYE